MDFTKTIPVHHCSTATTGFFIVPTGTEYCPMCDEPLHNVGPNLLSMLRRAEERMQAVAKEIEKVRKELDECVDSSKK